MYLGRHVKGLFLSILKEILCTRQTSLKIRLLNFTKFCPPGAQLSHVGRRGDGRTGRCANVMKMIVAISKNVKLPKEQIELLIDEYNYIVVL